MATPKKILIGVAAALAVTLIAILAWPSLRLAYHKRAYLASIRQQVKLGSSKSPNWALEIRAWFTGSRSPQREIGETIKWHRQRLHDFGFLETREFANSNRVDIGRLVKAGRTTFTNPSERYWLILPIVDQSGRPHTNKLGVRIEAPAVHMDKWQTLVTQCLITNTPTQ